MDKKDTTTNTYELSSFVRTFCFAGISPDISLMIGSPPQYLDANLFLEIQAQTRIICSVAVIKPRGHGRGFILTEASLHVGMVSRAEDTGRGQLVFYRLH